MSDVEAPSNTGVEIGNPFEIFSTSSNTSFLLKFTQQLHHNIFVHKYFLIFSLYSSNFCQNFLNFFNLLS